MRLGGAKRKKKKSQGGLGVGQLDTSPAGKARDVATLNGEIAALGQRFFPETYAANAHKLVLGVQHYKWTLAQFNLSAYETANFRRDERFFIRFDMQAPNLPERGSCRPFVRKLVSSTAKSQQSELLQLEGVVRQPVCARIEQRQQQRLITAGIDDILTTLPNKWFNSVAIDMYTNLLKDYFSEPHALYVVSAEDSPERRDRLREIQQTPHCFKYILSPLYRDHHWTVMFIDHTTREIFYLNSDVVDPDTPLEQTRPFEQAFPGYTLTIIPCLKQCDNSSCGAYVCFWSYAFLFLPRDSLLHISCPDILRFRTVIRHQLLLSYLLCPAFGIRSS